MNYFPPFSYFVNEGIVSQPFFPEDIPTDLILLLPLSSCLKTYLCVSFDQTENKWVFYNGKVKRVPRDDP